MSHRSATLRLGMFEVGCKVECNRTTMQIFTLYLSWRVIVVCGRQMRLGKPKRGYPLD